MAQWLAQRRQHEATTAHADTHQESSVTLSLPAWIAFMSEALMSGQTTYIGLLLHMYSRSTYDEAFTLQSRELITLASLGEGARRGFCDDVLYEIHG